MRPSKGTAGLRELSLAAAVACRLPSRDVRAACGLCHSPPSTQSKRAQPSSHCARPPLALPVTCVRRGGRRYLLHPWYPSGHRSPPSQLRAPAVGPLVSNSQKPNGRRVWSPRAKTVSPRPPTASLRFRAAVLSGVRCALGARLRLLRAALHGARAALPPRVSRAAACNLHQQHDHLELCSWFWSSMCTHSNLVWHRPPCAALCHAWLRLSRAAPRLDLPCRVPALGPTPCAGPGCYFP